MDNINECSFIWLKNGQSYCGRVLEQDANGIIIMGFEILYWQGDLMLCPDIVKYNALWKKEYDAIFANYDIDKLTRILRKETTNDDRVFYLEQILSRKNI